VREVDRVVVTADSSISAVARELLNAPAHGQTLGLAYFTSSPGVRASGGPRRQQFE
jgi:hypothetical protein